MVQIMYNNDSNFITYTYIKFCFICIYAVYVYFKLLEGNI